MKLYLVRHGEALPEALDPRRPLSEPGAAAVERVAELLGGAGVRVAEIEHSGKARAAETAELLARRLGAESVVARAGLKPDDAIEPFLAEVEARTQDLMAVGHLPFVGRAVSALLLGQPDSSLVAFEPATVVCLERPGTGRAWAIAWVVGPRVFG